ncbi:MAG: DedA family protein [Nanoarchaeota archaeon]
MEIILIDFVLHFDKYLETILQNYGILTYLVLFIIIFMETGLVFTPLLPGDSLLFVAGTLAGSGLLRISLLFFILSIAAIVGDSLNYWIGNYFGNRISSGKFVKKEYLERTQEFYKKHGIKTIILARFVPIIRTFAPFVAGLGKMEYKKFFLFNTIGGILWVAIFLYAGFFFGGIELIEKNLTYVIFGIIFISLIPIFWEFLKKK